MLAVIDMLNDVLRSLRSEALEDCVADPAWPNNSYPHEITRTPITSQLRVQEEGDRTTLDTVLW